MTFVSAFPLMCFPKQLKSNPNRAKSESHSIKGSGVAEGVKGFLSSVKRCLTNPVLVGCLFCGVLIFHMIAACLPFAAKYMESQFTLPAWKANILVGVTWVLPAVLGSLLTGLLITKVKLSPMSMLKVSVVSVIVLIVAVGIGFRIGCDTVEIVGFNQELDTSTSCSSACHCDEVNFIPVCGSDGQNYFSACHAGCFDHGNEKFTRCSCIGNNGTATLGLCESDCRMLGPYIVITCVLGFVFANVGLCIKMVGIRSVQDRDRSMAVGLALFLNNLIGWLPAPIIYGRLVDNVCMIWITSCTHLHDGACAIYDVHRFRIVQHTFYMVVSVLVLFSMCFVIFKARNKTDWNSNTLQFLPQTPDTQNFDQAEESKDALMQITRT